MDTMMAPHGMVHSTDTHTPEAPKNNLATLSTVGLLGTLGLAAAFMLLAPGQPLAALMGVPSCAMGG